MRILGLQRVTLIDYPGKIACTIFIFGCNFRCGFCHNPELIFEEKSENLVGYSESEILEFLNKRKGLIDGVCITGGEPTLYPELEEFISKIKEKSFLVKLDTNGSNPEMLRSLIDKKLIDYIAMDVKVPLERYSEFFGDVIKIKKSIEIVKNFSEHEFRTTVLPRVHSKEDILKIADNLAGAKKFVLQQFRKGKTVDESYSKEKTFSERELNEMRDEIKKKHPEMNIIVRINV